MKNPLDEIFNPTKNEPFAREKVSDIAVVINEETNQVEWQTPELSHGDCEKLRRLLGYKVAKPKHWSAVRSELSTKSIAQVHAKHGKKKGWSLSEIKAISAALSRLKL